MVGRVHLIKLSVGTESIETLRDWQAGQRKLHKRDHGLHVTRMWPKRSAELLNDGSIFWIIKGLVQARQRLIGFDEIIGTDGIRRCGIKLDPELIPTTHAPRRPFQGWRYLAMEDAPADLPKSRSAEAALPSELQQELDALGLR
ncbi:MAG: DUF1489 domain-containing protein [Pseudomonadota bacterium]